MTAYTSLPTYIDRSCKLCDPLDPNHGCQTHTLSFPPLQPPVCWRQFRFNKSISVHQTGTALTYSDQGPCGSDDICTDTLKGSVNGNWSRSSSSNTGVSRQPFR